MGATGLEVAGGAARVMEPNLMDMVEVVDKLVNTKVEQKNCAALRNTSFHVNSKAFVII